LGLHVTREKKAMPIPANQPDCMPSPIAKQEPSVSSSALTWTVCAAVLSLAPAARATDPFFITYTSYMQELRELEITAKSLTGAPSSAERFGATALEFEYGATKWWTSEFYLDGQVTANQGALFTGYRWDNRFKLLRGTHWINPVLYTEFEDINGADKVLLEVVGHDTRQNFIGPNDLTRHDRSRELDNKLILASYFKGWTVAENLIFEKNLSDGPWEFGYTAGISRPLSRKSGNCAFCADKVQLGVEAYGGLGTTSQLWLRDTSHYLAPVVSWSTRGATFRVSPTFGLNDNSAGFLLRFAVSYEVEGFGHAVAKLFYHP
jgi:hypothetical protein